MPKKSDKDLFPAKRSGKSSTKKRKTLHELFFFDQESYDKGHDDMQKDVLEMLDFWEGECLEANIIEPEEDHFIAEKADLERLKKRVEAL